jgi:ketosteroid isomerase-like protein
MRFLGQPIRASALASVLVLAGVFAGTMAQAHQPGNQKKHDVKQQVEALEEQWRTAQLAGDIATLDKMLSEDFIGISMTGQVNTKAQLLDRLRAHKVQIARLELSDMKVKLLGNIAIVTSRAEVEGTNDGMPIKGTYRYTRVYHRLPAGNWKITSFEATRVPGSREPRASETAPPPPGQNLSH